MTPNADLRDYLAEERTFLAWIRTSLALMGFGFVVAHFGPNQFSLWAGTALIAIGVAMNLLSIRRHLRVVEQLNRGQFDRGPSHQAVSLASLLALVGVAAAVYLLLA